MFKNITTVPPDPIFDLISKFSDDERKEKINLTVGVYQNELGETPIFNAIKEAEKQMLCQQVTKTYTPLSGDPVFIDKIPSLILGEALVKHNTDRICTVMTPGGCGALSSGAELLVNTCDQKTIWMSNPTWGNHYPLFAGAGLGICTYDYVTNYQSGINFNALLDAFSQIPSGQVVLLQAVCHNPTGFDLTRPQWLQLIGLMAKRKLIPFFDLAYQGFGDGLENDAFSVRAAVKELPVVLIASSCSKNFSLYRERTGAITVVTESPQQATAVRSHLLAKARERYSMPPYHGGGVVGYLLSHDILRSQWEQELETARIHINGLRMKLATELNRQQSRKDFSFLTQTKGMFCNLDVSGEVVTQLCRDYGIYMTENARINIAGLSDNNISHVAECVARALQY